MNYRMGVRIAAAILALSFVFVAGCSSKPSEPKITAQQAPQVREEALTEIQKGKMDDAQKKLEQVTKATPQDAKAQFLLGVTLYNKKQFKEAIEAYKKALTIDPGFIEAYNNIGNVYRDMKQVEDAAQWYRKAIEKQPGFSIAYINMAGMYAANSRMDEAIKSLQEGITANPTNLDMKLFLASTLKDAGLVDQAAAVLNDLLKEHPDFAPAQDLLKEIKK